MKSLRERRGAEVSFQIVLRAKHHYDDAPRSLEGGRPTVEAADTTKLQLRSPRRCRWLFSMGY